jgi:glyoxylase-like metal-dependent hydrolase (beta-lactamase superfamily II)
MKMGDTDMKCLRLSLTNSFLLKVDNRYVLIDTGYEYEWELFCKRLKEAGVRLSEISHIILTHAHVDHAGLLNRILEENQQISIVMSYRAKDPLLHGRNDPTFGAGYVNRRVNLLVSLKKVFDKRWTRTFPPYRSRENDILITRRTELGEIGIGLPGRIIETPGHCADSISVLRDNGDCFVGDAAANFLEFAGTKHCIIYIQDIDEYYASWKKLISAGARRIVPAHGKPFVVEELQRDLGKNKKNNMVMIK